MSHKQFKHPSPSLNLPSTLRTFVRPQSCVVARSLEVMEEICRASLMLPSNLATEKAQLATSANVKAQALIVCRSEEPGYGATCDRPPIAQAGEHIGAAGFGWPSAISALASNSPLWAQMTGPSVHAGLDGFPPPPPPPPGGIQACPCPRLVLQFLAGRAFFISRNGKRCLAGSADGSAGGKSATKPRVCLSLNNLPLLAWAGNGMDHLLFF